MVDYFFHHSLKVDEDELFTDFSRFFHHFSKFFTRFSRFSPDFCWIRGAPRQLCPSPAPGEAQRRAAAGAALAVAAGEALREAEHGGRWGKKTPWFMVDLMGIYSFLWDFDGIYGGFMFFFLMGF